MAQVDNALENEEACGIAASMAMRDGDMSQGESDFFDQLVDAVIKWEEKNVKL